MTCPSKQETTLPLLFPRPGISTAPPAPAGLTCLPMLLPELGALAEGLAPLASRPAVAALRLGVLSVFEAVCDKVHSSLDRLMGSSGSSGAVAAAGAGGGKDAGVSGQGALLAGYVVRVERLLRQFAEVDVQVGA